MNSNKCKLYFAIPVLLVSLTAYAHEPDEHANEAQPLDCSTMVGVDQSKTDANDPIIQAMLMKCKEQLASAELHGNQHHEEDNLVGDVHAETGHEHGSDVVVGDAHAHVESGQDSSTAAVAGAIAEHSHGDAHEEADHGDHGDHH